MDTAHLASATGKSGSSKVLDLGAFFSALDEGQPLPEVPEGVLTVEQIRESLNCGTRTARSRVRQAIDAGLCEMVKIPYQRIDGTTQRIPAYRFKGLPDKQVES